MSTTRLAELEDRLAESGLDVAGVRLIVEEALAEDLGARGVLPPGVGSGTDVTSIATIAPDAVGSGRVIARRDGVLAGIDVAAYAFGLLCAQAGPFELDFGAADGERISRAQGLLDVQGNARAMLRAERVALNLVTLMSGVATATRAWTDALTGTRAHVRDSRKTVPGLRMLQKYAVRVGGGVNHRMCLADAALIKDNHVIAAGGVVSAFRAVREAFPDVDVQVEVTNAEQARQVIAAGATDVLLDNMDAAQMAAVVAEHSGTDVKFEASGGLTLADAAEVASTGVHFIAIGALTHSAPILDIAFDLTT